MVQRYKKGTESLQQKIKTLESKCNQQNATNQFVSSGIDAGLAGLDGGLAGRPTAGNSTTRQNTGGADQVPECKQS